MMKGKTSSGFEYEIDEKALDDMRILDMVVAISNGDLTQLSPLMTKVLGNDQREKLYEHIEKRYGRASIKAVSDELTEIFSQGKTGKNSLPSPE